MSLQDPDGYVKLWRKLLRDPIIKHEGLLQLFIYCILRAAHADSFYPIQTGRGKTLVPVKRGQFIFGRKEVAADLGVNESTVYKRLHTLASQFHQKVVIQADTHYSIVSVCNYDKWQSSPDDDGLPNGQASNRQVTTKEQPSNTDKNVNNVKNSKNSDISSDRFAEFWDAWPKHHRKTNKARCEAAWRAAYLDDIADGVIALVHESAKSAQWQDPQFIPAPLVWLNQRRWEAPAPPPPTPGANNGHQPQGAVGINTTHANNYDIDAIRVQMLGTGQWVEAPKSAAER